MKTNKLIKISLTAILTILPSLLVANSIKTITNREGLSNSAIFSMHQDRLGHLWIGTTDGLDIWNGHSLEQYDSNDGRNFFAGNAIGDISEDNQGNLWILSYYGIAKLCTRSRQIEYYDQITQAKAITCDNDGTAYIISKDNSLYYYNKYKNTISKSPLRLLCKEDKPKRLLHRENTLFCFTDSGIYIIRTEWKVIFATLLTTRRTCIHSTQRIIKLICILKLSISFRNPKKSELFFQAKVGFTLD